MEDNQIIELYFARSEQAIARTDEKYGGYCYAIANNILSSHPDSQECVNDTYLNAWNAIPPQRPKFFRAFLGRITRNLALNRLDYNTAAKRSAQFAAITDEYLEKFV